MAEAEKKSKHHRSLIMLIVILPVVAYLFRELVTTSTIWHFRVVDLADLVVLTPIYIAVILYLFFYMAKAEAPYSLQLTFLIFAFVFITGQAMHFTANSINTYSTEVKDYQSIIPTDTYALIYFLDEKLSHYILFIGITGLLTCWFIFDRLTLAAPIMPGHPLSLSIVGAFLGVVLAYSLIEARAVWLLIPILVILTGLWLWFWRHSALPIRKYLTDHPFTSFVAILMIAALLLTVGYGLIYSGFPQPSETFLKDIRKT
jgi:hypothetical protein